MNRPKVPNDTSITMIAFRTTVDDATAFKAICQMNHVSFQSVLSNAVRQYILDNADVLKKLNDNIEAAKH